MKNHKLITILIATSIPTIACQKDGGGGAASEASSLAVPVGKLKTVNIEVCFHVPGQTSEALRTSGITLLMRLPHSDDQKRWMQEILQKEFSIPTVGIEFFGFKDCPANDAASPKMVRVARSESGSYRNQSGSIGDSWEYIVRDPDTQMVKAQNDFDPDKISGVSELEKKDFSKPLYSKEEVIVDSISRQKVMRLSFDDYCKRSLKIDEETCVKGLTLHEFGHIVGLRHEHIRPEALDDPQCSQYIKGIDQKSVTKETLDSSIENFGLPYDPNSIMNYCYMDNYEAKGGVDAKTIGLSVLDKKTLTLLYK